MSQEGKNLQEKIPVSRQTDPSDILTKSRLERRIVFIPLYPNAGLQLVALRLRLELLKQLHCDTHVFPLIKPVRTSSSMAPDFD